MKTEKKKQENKNTRIVLTEQLKKERKEEGKKQSTEARPRWGPAGFAVFLLLLVFIFIYLPELPLSLSFRPPSSPKAPR